MTLEVQEKLIFSGPFNEKLEGFLTLKNNDQEKKIALKFFSNVYSQRIAVWPKKALLLPNETVTATFKYRPSHPQGNDRIRIRSAVLMGSSIINMGNFDQLWNQLEAFRQIETSYVDIVHAENNAAQPKSDEFNGGSVEVNANPDVWNNVDAWATTTTNNVVENNAQTSEKSAWTQNQLWSNTVQAATAENAWPQQDQYVEENNVQETDQNEWGQDQNAWGQDQNAWGQDQNAWGQDQNAVGEVHDAQATADQNAWGQNQDAGGVINTVQEPDQNAWTQQDQVWNNQESNGNNYQTDEAGNLQENEVVDNNNWGGADWGNQVDENNNAANVVDNNAWGADWGVGPADENNNNDVANLHYDAAAPAHHDHHQVNHPGDVGHDQAVNANLENGNVLIDTLFALFAVLLFGIMIGKGMI